MNFSEQTFNALAEYERYFKTACDADWCPNPGRDALDFMAFAIGEQTGRRFSINHACGSCILQAVKRCGYLYFEDKAARAAQEAAAAPEAPKPTKTTTKKTTAAKAKKTTKK